VRIGGVAAQRVLLGRQVRQQQVDVRAQNHRGSGCPSRPRSVSVTTPSATASLPSTRTSASYSSATTVRVVVRCATVPPGAGLPLSAARSRAGQDCARRAGRRPRREPAPGRRRAARAPDGERRLLHVLQGRLPGVRGARRERRARRAAARGTGDGGPAPRPAARLPARPAGASGLAPGRCTPSRRRCRSSRRTTCRRVGPTVSAPRRRAPAGAPARSACTPPRRAPPRAPPRPCTGRAAPRPRPV
jgi:hypothetical protein